MRLSLPLRYWRSSPAGFSPGSLPRIPTVWSGPSRRPTAGANCRRKNTGSPRSSKPSRKRRRSFPITTSSRQEVYRERKRQTPAGRGSMGGLPRAALSAGRSYKDTCVHRLDPRAKVIATVLFLFTVISFPKYEVVALAPFFLFPVLLMAVGEIPILFIAKKMIIVSPFAIFIGIFNPFLDTRTAAVIAGIPVFAGLLSFLSLFIKFSLPISA